MYGSFTRHLMEQRNYEARKIMEQTAPPEVLAEDKAVADKHTAENARERDYSEFED